MSNRKRMEESTMNRIEADLMARTTSVNVSVDDSGRWSVRCYDRRGRFIGGTLSTSETDALERARRWLAG